MRIFNVQAVARPTPSDRNGAARVNSYGVSNVAPHAATNRFAYTVPAGRKAQLMSAYVNMVRDLAATAASYVMGRITYAPLGVSTTDILLAVLLNNTLGAGAQMNVGQSLLMIASDVITGTTTDLSTGGTIFYNLSHTLMEYDA